MNADNPVYELFVEALDCADRLPNDPQSWVDGIHRALRVIERPPWLPEFERLVMAMAETSSYSKKE